MPVVVDSSVLIDVLRGSKAAVDYLARMRRRARLVSVTPVRTEVLGGILSDEVRATMDLLDEIEWFDITVDLADVAGGLRRRFGPSHSRIDVVDYLVAALAVGLGAELATQNVRDFPMFPELAPPY